MDQADQLRRLVRETVRQCGELAPGAPAVVVSGAGAGAGVTTTACALACELARLGKQIVLIDANLAAPAIAERLNVRSAGALADVLAGSRRAIEVLGSAADGVHVLPGSPECQSRPIDQQSLERLDAELAALARRSDVLVVDAGSGMSPWIDGLWQRAQRVLLVAAPHSASIVDAYAAIKLARFDRLHENLQLAVNRCANSAEAARLHAGLDDTCRRFLACGLQAPAALPPIAEAGGERFRNAVRLLAADLLCDFRVIAQRACASTAVVSDCEAARDDASSDLPAPIQEFSQSPLNSARSSCR